MSLPPKRHTVKTPRRYSSELRQAQATATRRQIVDAALNAFLEHGYTGATMQRIAASAGVVVETIYRTFDGKAGLFKAAVEAAAIEPELESMRDQLETQRLEGMGRFAQHLRETGALRPDTSVDEARDVLWTLNSHDVHRMLVGERGWSQKQYRTWLARMLASALLAD